MKHPSQRLGGAVVAVSSLILAMLTSPVSAAPGAAVGDGSPIGDNQLAWPGSGTPAGAVGATGTVVEVALRPPFTRADLLSGHPGAVAAARDATDAAVAANPGHDLVIVVDRDGRPILGDESRSGRPDAQNPAKDNALSFTFDSPSAPWAAAEVTTMQEALAEFYPDAVGIYGPPFYDISVNIRKVPGMGGGVYTPSLNEMTMSSVKLDVLAHEMVHAFRDDRFIRLPSFEEGMARAVEVELLSRSPYKHPWDAGHSDYLDRAYEQLNDHANGSPAGDFPDNQLERYQLSGYAWWKALVERPAFLPAFNAEYMRLGGHSYDESTLVAMAEATIGGPVEGRPFRSWYDQQSVLDTRPPAVTYLHLRDYVAYAMTRDVTGYTWRLSDVTISWVARDVTGAVVDHGSALAPDGWIDLNPQLPPGHPGGRLDVEMTTTDPDGLPVQRRVPIPVIPDDTRTGVVGVVTSGTEGSVTITALDGQAPPVTVPVRNGAFWAPELQGVRGRFLAAYTPPSGPEVRRQFTRDISQYKLVLAAPNLSVTLTDNPDPVALDDTVRYQARVEVAGPSPANGVSFRLATPAGARVTGVGSDRGSCAVLTRNQTPVCWFEGMAPGTGADIWVDVVLGAEGVHTATASVVASELDPVYADDVASVDTTVTTTPDTTPPDTSITAPVPASIVVPGLVRIAGNASDDRVVAGVDYTVRNTMTGQWLQPDGTFGPEKAWRAARLDTEGERHTGFSRDVRLVLGGSYLVEAAAYDAAGNIDLDRPRTTFTIPADTSPPEAVLVYPMPDSTYPSGTLIVEGVAFDDRAVDRVDISLQNLATRQWRHADGTWGLLEWLPTELNSRTTAPSWSLAVTGMTPGIYGVRAVARDEAGLKSVSPTWRRFTVVAPDTTPPDGTIASPRANQTVRPGPVSFRGSASDNRAVASVQIAIQNRGTGRWRRLDGTWGPTPTWLPTTLGTAGGTRTSWSRGYALPVGDFGVRVRARDTAGLTDPTPSWRTFHVAR